MKPLSALLIASLLAGCGGLTLPNFARRDAPLADPAPPPEGTVRPRARPAGLARAAAPPEGARTVEALDTTSAAERAAATAPPAAGGRKIGTTIASLGAPTEPGFWLKTPLVTKPGKGRARYGANGKSVQLDLIPLDGPASAGSRISLAALRLLDAPLTALAELEVFTE